MPKRATHVTIAIEAMVILNCTANIADAATARERLESSAHAVPRTILVPLDGTELAEHAIPFAVSLARQHGSALLLVGASHGHHALEEAAAYLQRWHERLEVGCELRVAHDVAVGEPGRAIVDAATRHAADLVVMATHARTGVERAVKGSVADYVLRHAGAPVLLVPAACHHSWS